MATAGPANVPPRKVVSETCEVVLVGAAQRTAAVVVPPTTWLLTIVGGPVPEVTQFAPTAPFGRLKSSEK
jgi:hypothetical protein